MTGKIMSDGYWIFQIVQYKDGSGFGLHEVYYNGDEVPWGRTDNPEVLFARPSVDDDPPTAEGLRRTMALMLSDAIRHDILYEPEEWAECPFQDALDEMRKEHGIPEDQLEPFLPEDRKRLGYDDLLHDGRREEEPEVDPDV